MTEQNKQSNQESGPSLVLQPQEEGQIQQSADNSQISIKQGNNVQPDSEKESIATSQNRIEQERNARDGSENANPQANNINNSQSSIDKMSTYRSSVKRLGSQGSLKSQKTDNGLQQQDGDWKLKKQKSTMSSMELPKLEQNNFSRIALGGSSLMRSGEAASLGKMLGQVQRERKQTEMEALALTGRISLLKQEEENSRKKFFSTKKQTLEYFILKKNNENLQEKKRKDDEDKANRLKEKWEENEKQRLRKRGDRDFARNTVLESNRNHYLQVKKSQMMNESLLQSRNQGSLESNLNKKKMINQLQLQGTMKIFDFKNKQAEKSIQNYRQTIEKNEVQKQENTHDIQRMEQLELSLIKKLQVTQLLQRQAFEELQGIITMKSDDFSHQFNPVFSKKKVNQLIKNTTQEISKKKEGMNESQYSQYSVQSTNKQNAGIQEENGGELEADSTKQEDQTLSQTKASQKKQTLSQRGEIDHSHENLKNTWTNRIEERPTLKSKELQKTKSTFKQKKKSNNTFKIPNQKFPDFVF